MAPEITVREATEGDAEAVYVLARELASAVGDSQPEQETIRERLNELLRESRAQVFVAENDDEVIGMANAWIKPDLAHGDTTVEVPVLVVTENFRRGSVGKLLMQEIQQLAADNDATLIELIATSDNAAAREFYKSLGFVETDHITLEFMGEMEDPPDPDEQ